MDATPVGGVLLTGGGSRRLGRDKATLEVGGRTLAERAAGVLAPAVEEAIEVGPGHSGLPAVREDPAGAGPAAALVAGADALGTDHVVLLAVDLPLVDTPLLAFLAHRGGRPTAIPLVDGRLQLVCARYGPDALRAARLLLRDSASRSPALHEVVAAVEHDEVTQRELAGVASASAFLDVDTASDLERLRSRRAL